MSRRGVSVTRRVALLVCCLAASFAAMGGDLQSLTVCADPGNMPLSNEKGEGFENKIAQVIGSALGTGRAILLAPLNRARAHAHHVERRQLRSMDGHDLRH